jgi:hypothetical protein
VTYRPRGYAEGSYDQGLYDFDLVAGVGSYPWFGPVALPPERKKKKRRRRKPAPVEVLWWAPPPPPAVVAAFTTPPATVTVDDHNMQVLIALELV